MTDVSAFLVTVLMGAAVLAAVWLAVAAFWFAAWAFGVFPVTALVAGVGAAFVLVRESRG